MAPLREAPTKEESDKMEDGMEEEPCGEDVIVGSCDINALYPNLKKKECAEIVRELVMDSKLKFKGVGYAEVGKGISMLCKEAEIAKWEGHGPKTKNSRYQEILAEMEEDTSSINEEGEENDDRQAC